MNSRFQCSDLAFLTLPLRWSAPALAAVYLLTTPVCSASRGPALAAPIRGVTIGPIENAMCPDKGYGSDAYARTLRELRRWDADWVSLTPFGRVQDLHPTGVDLSFEAPFDKNRQDIIRAIDMAHAQGFRVMLVPHLWVESGQWRALIDPKTPEGWETWARGYARFVLAWARVAELAHVDLFSVGVELRSWVTTTHAPRFLDIIAQIRRVYHGPLTYSANWDDVQDTVILGAIDVIGINGFYPLTSHEHASMDDLLKGGKRVADQVHHLSQTWQRPVIFTEIGYTTRPDPALRPWEWPDGMTHVTVDQKAQADAYRGLLAPLLDEPDFWGFFVWRVYADPDDMTQEDEWGFSPRGKQAELVVRDAFRALWASDSATYAPSRIVRWRAKTPGFY